ncbi:pneumococcal serine-rich repeat protein-like isoform X2 [Sycon ciliatum]|uniref:pneumococcal serine-rich repeat protein-like isoform X2 n=1 Tax=Sycon ciliatum TaxID=27933 RepID=UPI0031F6A286
MATSTPEAALLRDLGLGRGEIAYHGIFTVEDKIGRGSDADVYRVVWQGIPVAAKVFEPRHDQADVEGRDNNLRRFGAEIARLSQLHHPNLCQILGVAVTADRHLPVLVVELFDHTLCECSVGADRFDHVALLSFLADAVAGVRYLHSRDPPVIHRDLTLRNVLIKGQIAKLCDFGCARLRPTSPADLVGFLPDLTACPGHVLYMAPEALQNPPVYDESLDIFSLGVLATSVVTGVEPSTDLLSAPRTIIRQVERADGTSEETVTAITEVERRCVDLRRIPDSHPLKPAIFRCLAVVAEDRPKAEELHELVLDTVKVARGLSPPHLSNVPPAVVRRLDSISQQLTQQATSITALSARSDTLEEQLTAAITNNQTTTQQQITATREQVSAVQDEQSSATQRLTEHLEAIAENQTMAQQQLTATQHTIHNEQTTTSRRVQTLADQLCDTNEQTSRQMATLTDQILAVSGQLSTMSATTHQLQIRPTTAPESLLSSASAAASATTAVVPVSSPIAAQDSRSSSASAPAPASPTATRLQVRPTTAPESLSSSASATASATTATVPVSSPIAAQDSQSSSASATAPAMTGSPAGTRLQIRPTTAPESLSSSASATASTTTSVVPVCSPIAAQDSRSSSNSATALALAPASPTATRLQIRPTTAPESLSSSASATASATTASVPVSSPIAAQDSRSSSASAPAPAPPTATTLQVRPTTAPESLSSPASPISSATTATEPVTSPIAAQNSRSSLASATAPAPASPTATGLQVMPTTAPESLSSSASATASAATATVPVSSPIAAQDSRASSASATAPATASATATRQLQGRPTTAPESLSSTASATASATTATEPFTSPIAAQNSRSSLASATAPTPASPTATGPQVMPTSAPESLSSSASATASVTTATVPVSSPIAAQDSQSSSASASAPAVTGSPAVTRAHATGAANTAVSSVGRGYHVLPAMPTPTQIANIKKRRMWNKSVGQQHGKHARLATYSDKLVAVWRDGVNITKITETSDLQTWHSIDLPSEYSKLTQPSLASHGGMLYMYCNTYTKSSNTWVRSILQYCDTPDNGDGGRSGGDGGDGGGQWTKLTDVPSQCYHDWCSLHVCHDAISLYGGRYADGTYYNHVSTYSLASKQWSSSSSSNASLVLPSLPLPCSVASLVTFPDSLYIVGGPTGCFLKHHDGRWVSTSPPDGVKLKFSAACALSDHCMVICPGTPSAKCVVYDISSGQVYPLPAMPEYSAYTPSLTLFGSTLVLSVGGPDSPGSLYTLDMSV